MPDIACKISKTRHTFSHRLLPFLLVFDQRGHNMSCYDIVYPHHSKKYFGKMSTIHLVTIRGKGNN